MALIKNAIFDSLEGGLTVNSYELAVTAPAKTTNEWSGKGLIAVKTDNDRIYAKLPKGVSHTETASYDIYGYKTTEVLESRVKGGDDIPAGTTFYRAVEAGQPFNKDLY